MRIKVTLRIEDYLWEEILGDYDDCDEKTIRKRLKQHLIALMEARQERIAAYKQRQDMIRWQMNKDN